MISFDENALDIFENFSIDRNLPKHKIEEGSKIRTDSESWGTPVSGNFVNVTGDASYNGRKLKLRERIGNWFLKKPTPKPVVKELTVIEFFNSLAKTFKELTPMGEIAEHYDKALTQAKTMGQVALFEQLTNNLDIIKSESQLIAMDIRKYVTEKQVIKFYKKVEDDKNLKLTWIKNFARIIPEDVYLIKEDVDERKIFDNYVILHYDPKDNGEKLTKKEIEKKKDPILFGVIKDSRKLYYLADWKDDTVI